jgi:hypothetical protein
LRGGIALPLVTAASCVAIVRFPTDRHQAVMHRRVQFEGTTARPLAGLLGWRSRGELRDPVAILDLLEDAEHQAGTERPRRGCAMPAAEPESRADAAHEVDALAKTLRIEEVAGYLAAEERRIQFADEKVSLCRGLREICPWNFRQKLSNGLAA